MPCLPCCGVGYCSGKMRRRLRELEEAKEFAERCVGARKEKVA